MIIKTDMSYPDFDELSYADYAKLFKRNQLETIYPFCLSYYQDHSNIDLDLRIKWSYADNLYVYNDWISAIDNNKNYITMYAIVVYHNGAGIMFVGNKDEIKIELDVIKDEEYVFDVFVSDDYIHYDQFYNDIKLVIDITNNHAVRYELNEKFKKEEITCISN